MKKNILVIILLLLVIVSLTGCTNKYRRSFDDMNAVFIDAFSNEDDIKTYDIRYLSALNYEGKYYYLVQYTEDGNTATNSYLYIFNENGDTLTFFSLVDTNYVYTNHSDDYNQYTTGLSVGRFIEFNEKEINKMINKFYGF